MAPYAALVRNWHGRLRPAVLNGCFVLNNFFKPVFEPITGIKESHPGRFLATVCAAIGVWIGFLAALTQLSLTGAPLAISSALAATHVSCLVIGRTVAAPQWRVGLAGGVLVASLSVALALDAGYLGKAATEIVAPPPNYAALAWKRDLLSPPKFTYLAYAHEQHAGKNTDGSKRFSTILIPKGFSVRIAGGTTLEMSAPIAVPGRHLGRVALMLGLSASKSDSAMTLFLLRTGYDPLVLDTIKLTGEFTRRYLITSLAGSDATLLFKIAHNGSAQADIRFSELAIESAPPGGNILIQAIKTWDGKNLDGSYDEFWYDIYKAGLKGELLFFRRVRMSDGGYTDIQDLPVGDFVVRGTFHSILLEQFGSLHLDGSAGHFLRYHVPSAIPVTVRIATTKGAPVQGADLVVTANGPSGKNVRGGGGALARVITDKEGRATLWLYPTARVEDFYMVRAERNGRILASDTVRLPPKARAGAVPITLVAAD